VDILNEIADVLKFDANIIDDHCFTRFLQRYCCILFSPEFSKFSCHKLVLREAEVHYRLTDNNKATETIIVITADAYIHLTKSLHRRLDPLCKSDFMFKLDKHIRIIDIS
jgi:hypothetical protein